MTPAESMGKDDCRTASGALVVDLGARVLNITVSNRGWISSCGGLFLLRLSARRHKCASSREAGEFCEIASGDHVEEANIVAQRVTAQAKYRADTRRRSEGLLHRMYLQGRPASPSGAGVNSRRALQPSILLEY